MWKSQEILLIYFMSLTEGVSDTGTFRAPPKQTADLCTKISFPYRFDESYLSALGKQSPTENLKKIGGAAFE